MAQPVFLCTIDAIRSDWFTRDYFPETTEFLSDFVTFTDAWSHGTATPLAFPHILTGAAPERDGTLDSDHATVAERLSNQPAVGFGNNPHLTADKGYNRDFGNYSNKALPGYDSTADILYRLKELGNNLPGSKIPYEIYSAISLPFPTGLAIRAAGSSVTCYGTGERAYGGKGNEMSCHAASDENGAVRRSARGKGFPQHDG